MELLGVATVCDEDQMNILKNAQLQALNTLHLNAVATELTEIHHKQDIVDALDYAQQQQRAVMILSGGSNVLLSQNIDALVLHMKIKGIELLNQDEKQVELSVAAGECWHDFVLWSTTQGYYGLQNLALIPGLVGAAPVQNIGAYGVEVGEFIHAVDVYDRELSIFRQLSAAECKFAYRDSLFKQLPQRYVICAVHFKLLKHADVKVNYGDLKAAMGDDLSPENLEQQVIRIRQSKLPDPAEFPNAGSFFKNPVISAAEFAARFTDLVDVPHYPQPNQQVKLAAGWLIEQAGWKGKRLNNVGMYHKQALVLVNYAQANLDDVQHTYQAVQKAVHEKFGVFLQPEPVLIDATGQIQAHTEAA